MEENHLLKKITRNSWEIIDDTKLSRKNYMSFFVKNARKIRVFLKIKSYIEYVHVYNTCHYHITLCSINPSVSNFIFLGCFKAAIWCVVTYFNRSCVTYILLMYTAWSSTELYLFHHCFLTKIFFFLCVNLLYLCRCLFYATLIVWCITLCSLWLVIFFAKTHNEKYGNN